MSPELKANKGYILYLDQLGFSYKTANDLSALNTLMSWLTATKTLIDYRKKDVFFSWASDTWILFHNDVNVLYNIVDDVFPRLFDKKIYLRGALVYGRFYNLSNLPMLKCLKRRRNVFLAPLMGAGITRAAKIESSSIKGMRIAVDLNGIRLPKEGLPISEEERSILKEKLKDIYDWDTTQSPMPALADYPWWQNDYQNIMKELVKRISKCKNESEKTHLLSTLDTINRWRRDVKSEI